jgi:ribonuclease D
VVHRLVVDEAGLRETIDALADAPRYAVDTEFHRERTYFPQVALLQVVWDGSDEVVLIDPLAVDVTPLRKILEGPGVAVMHAASQDLEVFKRACAAVPGTLFDTQLAAGFLGYSSPSLATLVEREVGVRLPKGDRLTDWLRRPLARDQLSYAASDVVHLLELHDRLCDQLAARDRLAWAEDECEELRLRTRGNVEPEDAWTRLKDARHLRGQAQSIAQAVAAWRERTAARSDQPVRFVLPDLALLSIAQRPPHDLPELRNVRGLDDRHLRGGAGREILDAVGRGLAAETTTWSQPRDAELDRNLRPAVTLVSAWVSQLARDLHLDTGLLATRADLVALLRGDPDARLTKGWRAELVGEPIRRLVHGDAALAFDGEGELVLEERTGRSIP